MGFKGATQGGVRRGGHRRQHGVLDDLLGAGAVNGGDPGSVVDRGDGQSPCVTMDRI